MINIIMIVHVHAHQEHNLKIYEIIIYQKEFNVK